MAEKKKTKKEVEEKEVKKKPAVKRKKIIEKKVEVAPLAEEVPSPLPEVRVAPKIEAVPPKKFLPEGPRYYATGRRKEAAAKVWLVPGSGSIMVNDRPMEEYFCGRALLEYQIKQPFMTTQTLGKYDVVAEAYGGGIPGQAGAVRLGIARALLQANSEFKSLLKHEAMLTRDPRMKERKKYGHKRARRSFQYTKR